MHQQGQTKGWCKVFGLAQSKGFCPFLSKFMTAFLSVFCKMPSFWVKLGIQIFQNIPRGEFGLWEGIDCKACFEAIVNT